MFNKKQKMLTKEKEYELIRNWQNSKDNNSFVELLNAYKPLVFSLVKKFSSYGLPQDDLLQEGKMGLMYAIEKFDISKGFRLSTYSRWWIRAMIQDYIIKNWSIVKNGSTASQKILFFNFNKVKKMINLNGLKTMDIDDIYKISKMLNMKPLDIEHLSTRLIMGDQSLNQTIKENESAVELIDLLKDNSDTQNTTYQKNNDGALKQKWILQAINKLDEREKFIINSRKLTDSPITLESLGKKFKISKERVRQIEVTSLKKLKKNILQISNEPKEFFVN
tara:strand:- start:28 stop:861 length:834 start_codon:yes stop_codon:yes gene_type:complete